MHGDMKRTRATLTITLAAGVLLAAAVLACNMPGRAEAEPTPAGDQPERIQTMQAQRTQLADSAEAFQDEEALATLNTPQGEAAQPGDLGTPRPTPAAGPDGAPTSDGALNPNPPQAEGANTIVDVGGFDGGDGYATSFVGSITKGQTLSNTINTLAEAHNYTFEGSSGTTVTITVEPNEFTDTRVKLISPDGTRLRQADGGNQGGSETITYELNESGTFTIRIDLWPPAPGQYSLTLN